jgi:hypothetical protein
VNIAEQFEMWYDATANLNYEQAEKENKKWDTNRIS